jgi:hypothetical protein
LQVLVHRCRTALRRRGFADPAPALNDHPEGGLMSLESRLESLKSRHASLERSIADEDLRPQPDSQTLARLKREKLRLKEEMERMRDNMAHS